MSELRVIGARQNNLQDVTLTIPKHQFVVFSGVSGSGKSSLAFDTIFAEAQREFLDSLSSYARTSMPRIQKPDVDFIQNLSPCVVINQAPLGRSPRSTVGTATDVYSYLRLLYSRLGRPRMDASDFSFNRPSGACESCRGLGFEMLPDMPRMLDKSKSLNQGAILHKGWRLGSRSMNIIAASGFFDMDLPVGQFSEVQVELLLHSPSIRASNEQPGYVQSFAFEGLFSKLSRRQQDRRGLKANEYDAQFFDKHRCRSCGGARLNARTRSAMLAGCSIVDLVLMELSDLRVWLQALSGPVAEALLPQLNRSLGALCDVGLGYLNLSRAIGTLSGGESQRLKIARQLGSSLTELIYILDEPTRGLHPCDALKLVAILRQLRDKGNSVFVVEHDLEIMRLADYLIDIGPGAGKAGGRIVGQGSPEVVQGMSSPTAHYLSGRKRLRRRDHCAKEAVTHRVPLVVRNARTNNLRNITVEFVEGALNALVGVSGSGKSSLLEDLTKQHPTSIVVDQSPVGRNSRSIPATYVKAFGGIRREFARGSGMDPSLLSFNGKGGCETCKGLGYVVIDMHFLGEVRDSCSTCHGKRYLPTVLKHKYGNKSMADVLEMTITEGVNFFSDVQVCRALRILVDVGLGYLALGQPMSTLSGGEAQRVKLASRLQEKGQLYLLDEPTAGLHAADIAFLVGLLQRLVEKGNTVIVVEHHIDFIACADWVVELGPGAGESGGRVVAAGEPRDLVKASGSKTGEFLAPALSQQCVSATYAVDAFDELARK